MRYALRVATTVCAGVALVAAGAPGVAAGPAEGPSAPATTAADPVWNTVELADATGFWAMANPEEGAVWASGLRRDLDAPVPYERRMFVRDMTGVGWQQMPVSAPAADREMRDLDGLSATNGMAVGWYTPEGTGAFRALTWDGTSWRDAEVPAPTGTVAGELRALDVIDERNAWAVGYASLEVVGPPDPVWKDVPVLRHWDGSRWNSVEPPATADAGVVFNDVAGLAPDNVWAVGGTEGAKPLVAHYDGTAWRHVVTPGAPDAQWVTLTNLLARGADDIWAIGSTLDSGPSEHGLVLHFDGTSWTRVDVPPDVFAFESATLTPGGFTAVASLTSGPGVIRYENGRWQTLKLPDSQTPGSVIVPSSVMFERGTLTVSATDRIPGTELAKALMLNTRL